MLITPVPGGTEAVTVGIKVDGTGALVGGVPGDDLSVVGEIDLGAGGVVSGVLLTGEVTEFGFRDSGGPTDDFEFKFTVTGGQLASLFPATEIGVSVNSEASTFVGLFNADFGGQAKGTMGTAPADCAISVAKTCAVVLPPPSTSDLLCQDKIAATTLRYVGPDRLNATVVFDGDKKGIATYANVDLVSGVTVLTSPGQNDFTVDARADGGDELGSKTKIFIDGQLEIIHTSCSAIYAAGQPAPLDGGTPNPPNSSKGDPSPNWFVVDFIDKSGGFVETPPPTLQPVSSQCEIPTLFDTTCTKRPTVLTLRYSGGDCSQTSHNQDSGKVSCSGDAGAGPVRIVARNGGDIYLDAQNVVPGDVVDLAAATVGRSDLDSELDFEVFSGPTLVQQITFHTSCSQPLALGNQFGSLAVVSFQNAEQGLVQLGAQVDYQYKVMNTGSSNVEVTSVLDDKLGEVLGPLAPHLLLPGGELTLMKSAFIDTDTTNTVTVMGRPATGTGQCLAASSANVKVLPPPPAPFVCSDAKPLNGLTMIWDGTDTVRVVAHRGKTDKPVLGIIDNVAPGQTVNFSGFAGTGNDQEWEIFLAGTGIRLGLSRFHVSCSDEAMNGPEDCGMNQGDSKDNKSSRINDWLLDGIEGQNGVTLSCSAP